MAGMYGLGYGAGAMGAGLGQGMVQGAMLAPQLQAQGLQNQQRQMSVDEQKALQQEYALAPQVLADPSIKNPDGSFNSAALFSRLPRLGPPLLQSAAGAGLTTAHANMYGAQTQDVAAKTMQDQLKAKQMADQQFAQAAGSLLNITDPQQRWQAYQQVHKQMGGTAPDLTPEELTDDRLRQIQVGGTTAYQQITAEANNKRINGMLQNWTSLGTSRDAMARVRQEMARIAGVNAGTRAADVVAKINGGFYTRPDGLDFEALVRDPQSEYYNQPDKALQHIDQTKAAQAQLGKASPADQLAQSMSTYYEDTVKLRGRAPTPEEYAARKKMVQEDYANAQPQMPPASKAGDVGPAAPRQPQKAQPANPAAAQHSIKEYQVGQAITDSSGRPAKDGTYNLADGTIVVNGGKALFITPKGK